MLLNRKAFPVPAVGLAMHGSVALIPGVPSNAVQLAYVHCARVVKPAARASSSAAQSSQAAIKLPRRLWHACPTYGACGVAVANTRAQKSVTTLRFSDTATRRRGRKTAEYGEGESGQAHEKKRVKLSLKPNGLCMLLYEYPRCA
jgi:hypothetical protein